MKNKQKPNAIKAFMYCRVSSKEQEDEGYSLAAQAELLRHYAYQNGILIEKEFIEAETAKKAGRKLFNEMLSEFKKTKNVTILLVEKTDRLYRNFHDYVKLEDLEVEVHFVKENQILNKGSHSKDKFMHGINLLMAKSYIDNLSEEVRKGLLQKVKDGGYPRSAPMGYINNKNTREIEIDPKPSQLVKKLFEWYATGNYSLKTVREKAQSEGLLNGLSKYKTSKNTIHKLLQNHVYYGKVPFKGELYEGKHTPIISEDLFNKVQDVLLGKNQPISRRKNRFLYSGLLKCSKCGCAIVGEIKKGKYIYYHCTQMKGPCDNIKKLVREEVLDKQFERLLLNIKIDNERLEWIREALKQHHAGEKQYHQELIRSLSRQSEQLQDLMSRAYEDRLMTKGTNLDTPEADKLYKTQITKWTVEQREVTQQIATHQSFNHQYFEKGMKILELANRAHELYAKQCMTEKQKLLRCFLNYNSVLTGNMVDFELKKPFDEIIVAKESKKWRGRRDSNPRPPA